MSVVNVLELFNHSVSYGSEVSRNSQKMNLLFGCICTQKYLSIKAGQSAFF